jgi:hypothetical protein
MKTANLLLLLAALCIIACEKKSQPTDVAADTTAAEAKPVMKVVKLDARKIGGDKSSEQVQIDEAIRKMEENDGDPVVGYWVGAFGHNKINIAIADVENGNALGYTVCAGNFRPITGTVTISEDSVYSFIMNEPGTDQYDGHFIFKIDLQEDAMEGQWSPFKKGAASSKTFTLNKTKFEYNEENGTYPQASSRVLDEEDVANLLKEELEVMRNEIYARHGYSFKDKEMRQTFDTVSWYVPMGIDIRANLTDVEVVNIDLIYEYENYQEENYDDYGR